MTNEARQINCSISNCHYWGRGNLCQATSILVTSDTMSRNLPDTIDAPYGAQITETPVSNGQESCCKTFVLNNDYNQDYDGVLKKQAQPGAG